MNNLLFVFNYLRYYLTAQTKYDIHSPFVFDFTTKVLNGISQKKDFAEIEALRKKLKNNSVVINVLDFGAGGKGNGIHTKSISSIAGQSAKSTKYAQLLFGIVNYFKPQNMLELGTSLGISALYQSKANHGSNFFSVEGSTAVAEIAKENFDLLRAKNIKLICGSFDEMLPGILQELKTLDYVFFDGNHRMIPTLKYFEMCLQKANANSVFVFDDINWSTEMKQTWQEIKKNPCVTVSIDLFVMGIVFINPGFSKEEFRIRY